MALAPLATEADLEARGIDTSNADRVTALLEAASSAVRAAAGSPITVVTATIALPTPEGRRLALPTPVRSVSSVEIDGQPVTDYRLSGNSLWRYHWRYPWELPGEVHVSLTYGRDTAPADVVDLVCNLVGAGLAHAEDGYESRSGVTSVSESVDDYTLYTQYQQGAAATASPMELPAATRASLRRRFGTNAVMVVSRS